MFFLSFCCLLVSPTPTPDKLQPRVSPYPIYISNITYSGEGCPSASESVEIAVIPGSGNIEITYTNLTARTGSAIPSRDNFVGCWVTFTLNYPAGKTFASYNSTLSGDINLSTPTLDAARWSTYKSTGHPVVSFETRWPLGYKGAYSVTDHVALGVDPGSCPKRTQAWFELETHVGVPYIREGYGQIDALKQVLVFNWAKCQV